MPRRYIEETKQEFDTITNTISEPLDRACLVLRYRWGLTPNEIGHAFGITGDQVSTILERIQKNLQDQHSHDMLTLNVH